MKTFFKVGCFLAFSFAAASTAVAQSGRSAELILDMSSSMLKDLPFGTSKAEAAKSAVRSFLGDVDRDTRLGLRVYGHQSWEANKNCRDTEQVIELGPSVVTAPQIRSALRQVEPRGYSPISLALDRAAKEISLDDTSRKMLILVSDGKETCSGDPCATARTLSRRYPDLVIHTIGFSVGSTARQQLQCVARAANGRYYDAVDADELADRMGEAYAELPRGPRRVVVVESPEPGRITVEPAGDKHVLRDSGSGEIVTALNSARPSAPVPAGIYSLSFGNGEWKSIEVEGGEETLVEPGLLEIKSPSVMGHSILDPDTNEIVAEVTPTQPTVTLVPDTVVVRFGDAIWKDVKIEAGRKTMLNPGTLAIENAVLDGQNMRMYPVYSDRDEEVGKLSLSHPRIPLPPGSYSVDILGRRVPVELSPGRTLVLKVE